jgi:3-oxoacyl-[acyl-carrier-protein] synthase II
VTIDDVPPLEGDDLWDPGYRADPKRYSRSALIGVIAAREAWSDAGLRVGEPDAGVIVGSGGGGIDVGERQYFDFFVEQGRKVTPYAIPISIVGMVSSEISISLRLHGISHVLSCGCTSSTDAIGYAAALVRSGEAEVLMTGGTDACVTPGMIYGFSRMKVVSMAHNDAPAAASRPFDRRRDGFVLGEGAGVLVLEAREHAEARGARILGILRGFGNSCDAHHMSAPLESGEGVMQAIEMAIKEAGVDKSEIGVVNAHATSTPLGDVAEVKALTKVFGPHMKNMKVHSTKSMTGHLLGGASAIEAIDLVMTLNSGDVHPTINVIKQDPEIDIDCVPNLKSRTSARFGISNSFGFGGHNSCIVIERGF